jgi:hypothetical protein
MNRHGRDPSRLRHIQLRLIAPVDQSRRQVKDEIKVARLLASDHLRDELFDSARDAGKVLHAGKEGIEGGRPHGVSSE